MDQRWAMLMRIEGCGTFLDFESVPACNVSPWDSPRISNVQRHSSSIFCSIRHTTSMPQFYSPTIPSTGFLDDCLIQGPFRSSRCLDTNSIHVEDRPEIRNSTLALRRSSHIFSSTLRTYAKSGLNCYWHLKSAEGRLALWRLIALVSSPW